MIKARFTQEGVVFERYTYPGARVYPRGHVTYKEIDSINPNAFPPEIRLKNGEILFIPATQKKELEEAAKNNKIGICRRIDVWSGILEPFLDTEFDHEHTERTIQWLEQNGIMRAEVMELRKELDTRMSLYNGILWEWQHLGLMDVLDAWPSRVLPAWIPIVHSRFKRFYWRAMEIAQRGRVILE